MIPQYLNPPEQELQTLFLENHVPSTKTRGPLFGALTLLEEVNCLPGEGSTGQISGNQEILTVMLEGNLVHKNSSGTLEILPEGGIQLASAGAGLSFSEFNPSQKLRNRYLRIGFQATDQSMFRKYEQISGPGLAEPNQLSPLALPFAGPLSLQLGLQAWVWLGLFEGGKRRVRHLLRKAGNGLYAYLLTGRLRMEDQWLERGDHFALADSAGVSLEMQGQTRFVLIEVPHGG